MEAHDFSRGSLTQSRLNPLPPVPQYEKAMQQACIRSYVPRILEHHLSLAHSITDDKPTLAAIQPIFYLWHGFTIPPKSGISDDE